MPKFSKIRKQEEKEKYEVILQQPSIGRSFITIPSRYVKKLKLMRGDVLEMELNEDQLMMRPKKRFSDNFK